MLSNGLNNIDPPFAWEVTTRAALTENELSVGASVIHADAFVQTDYYYGAFFSYSRYGDRLEGYSDNKLIDSMTSSILLLVRERSTVQPQQQYMDLPVVLDSGSVKAYLQHN